MKCDLEYHADLQRELFAAAAGDLRKKIRRKRHWRYSGGSLAALVVLGTYAFSDLLWFPVIAESVGI